MKPEIASLDSVLRDLLTILQFESEAVRGFDLQGIDTATQAKQEIEPLLGQALVEFAAQGPSPEALAEISKLRQDVTSLAVDNQRRIRASLTAVTSLVTHMTGQERTTYGRNTERAIVRPVLTSDVG